MGALTLIRKRSSDFISSHTPSSPSPPPPTSSSSSKNKRPRITYACQVEVQSTVARLHKYPQPVGPNLRRREVHAPCPSSRCAFLSNSNNNNNNNNSKTMGNVIGSGVESLWRAFETTKDAALATLRHVKRHEESFFVEESSEILDIEKDTKEADTSEDLSRRDVVHSPSTLSLSTLLSGREAYKELLSSLDKKYSPKLQTLEFEIKSNEAKLRVVRSRRKTREEKEEAVEVVEEKVKKPQEDLLRELFVPLSEEEEGEVKTAFSNSNRRKVLVTHENSNIPITGEKLQCLRPGAWLNDEVINVYLELLKERERREPNKYLTCHFFNTFFYKKLIGGRNGYDYKAVKRWTSLRKLGYKLSDCDKIFVPIHKEVHWCLAVINNKDKTFQYLDSLGGRDLQVLSVLAKYYVDEVKDKCGQDIDVNSWQLEYVEDLPEQQNGFDCGVFMIKYADFYSRGMGLHFSQENMPYFRCRTAKEILRLQAQ
ncbi:hypothetical protein vseg_012217 [Gypsophila vaccaria]